MVSGTYSKAPIPLLPTILKRCKVVICSGFIPFPRSIRSTNNLPQPSGRLSANTPKSPSKVSYLLGMKTLFSKGRDSGLIANPFFSQSESYSKAVKYSLVTASLPTLFSFIYIFNISISFIQYLLYRCVCLFCKQQVKIFFT